MDRSLSKHSVNTDNQRHLAALSSFASSERNTPRNPKTSKSFLRHAQALLPALERFLAGDTGIDAISLMREHTPLLRDAVRDILRDIDTACQSTLLTEHTQELRAWFEFGVHVEALVFALFPERWERLNLGSGDWDTPEVFRSNAHWVREGLQNTDRLFSLWGLCNPLATISDTIDARK